MKPLIADMNNYGRLTANPNFHPKNNVNLNYNQHNQTPNMISEFRLFT